MNQSVRTSVERILKSETSSYTFNADALLCDAKKVAVFARALDRLASAAVQDADNWSRVQPVHPQMQQTLEALRELVRKH